MATLVDEVKAFIVQRLACWDSPKQVAAAVTEEFRIKMDRRQVEKYDATRAGKKPAKKWVALFTATRNRFEDTIDEIPAAKKAVRVRRLDRMALKAEESGNFPLAKELLETVAKEVGGAFTNRRELTGAGGGPIQAKVDGVLSAEEMAARLRTLLDRTTAVVHSAPAVVAPPIAQPPSIPPAAVSP
jgi:hypothetical protein